MSDSSGSGTTGGPGNPPPGWYPAGEDSGGEHRWWDGSTWTEHTGGSPGGPPPGGAPAAPDEATRVRQRPIDLPPEGSGTGAAGAGAGAAAYPSGPTGGTGGPGGYPGGSGFPPGPGQAAPFGQPGQPGQFGQPGQPGQFGQPAPFGQPENKKGLSKALIGAIVGGVVVVIVVIVLLVVLLGGGGGGGGSAQEVAEDFTAAISDGDIAAACELVDEGARDDLLGETDAESCSDLDGESIPGFENMPDDVSVTFELGEVTEDGDEATADISVSATYDGDDEAVREQIEAAPATDGTIELSREDGDWVVSDFS